MFSGAPINMVDCTTQGIQGSILARCIGVVMNDSKDCI